jgi:hypothetical protein
MLSKKLIILIKEQLTVYNKYKNVKLDNLTTEEIKLVETMESTEESTEQIDMQMNKLIQMIERKGLTKSSFGEHDQSESNSKLLQRILEMLLKLNVKRMKMLGVEPHFAMSPESI